MSNYKLNELLDLNKWQALQDSLADVTGFAIITTDYKGQAITSHSRCSPFCALVRHDEELLKRCQKCDSRAGLEAVCNEKPYIYLCHYNIVDIAIPISVDDKYVGAVLAGQVRISDGAGFVDLEQIHHSPTSLRRLGNSRELQELYAQIPVFSYKHIHAVSHMLSHLCNYIVDEAKNKNLILRMYETLIPETKKEPVLKEQLPDKISEIKSALSNALTTAYIHCDSDERPRLKNPALNPVIDYIHAHKEQMLSLTDAARICHLSPSHLSRVFLKEMGQSFSSYVIDLKMEWAKQLLTKTDLSVTQISDELGFNSPGYFIKTFKKQEQVTPLVYRNYTN